RLRLVVTQLAVGHAGQPRVLRSRRAHVTRGPVVWGPVVRGPVVQARAPVPFLRVRAGTTSRRAVTQRRLRAGVRQRLLGTGYRPDVLAAAGRRERLRLIARIRIAGCLVGGGRGVADLGHLVPGNAAGRTGRPVAGPAEVARRSAVPMMASPVMASPVITSRERGIAVRGLRALVGRVGVPRVAVAEVVHGGLLVRRARAVGRLEHVTRLRVELPEAVGPGDLGPERRLA